LPYRSEVLGRSQIRMRAFRIVALEVVVDHRGAVQP
jgi:hypothetical protein